MYLETDGETRGFHAVGKRNRWWYAGRGLLYAQAGMNVELGYLYSLLRLRAQRVHRCCAWLNIFSIFPKFVG
jgi:hypothetical protein